MKPTAIFAAALALGAILLAADSASAQGSSPPPGVTDAEPLVQTRSRRARPRIRVQPIYPHRRYHALYPLPYDVESPGPNARRECSARYVQEIRPSGTVVVPRMHCWWVGG